MQKFGEGNVKHDPEDPQGVPVDEGVSKQGAAGRHSTDRLSVDLQAENDNADAAPAPEQSER